MTPTVFVFPGQGAYQPGLIGELVAGWPSAAAHFGQIEQVVRDEGLPSLLDAVVRGPSIEEMHPELLQFAQYGAAVALYEVLRDEGVRPAVLMGHSFGEIAALRCGGAFSTTGGARIVAARNRVLREHQAGRMIRVRASADDAGNLAERTGAQVAVACLNGQFEQVLSGPSAQIALAGWLARDAGLRFTELPATHAYHNSLLAPAAEHLRVELGEIGATHLDTPVYSPIEQRFYRVGEPLAERLAQHLVQPVDFHHAVSVLGRNGMRVLVECGPASGLTELARDGLPALNVLALRYRAGRVRSEIRRIADAARTVPARA